MGSKVIIQRRVDTAGSESVRDREQTEMPELRTDGVTENRKGCDRNADCGHFSRTETMGEPFTHQAGRNCAAGYDHINQAGAGQRCTQLPLDSRPD